MKKIIFSLFLVLMTLKLAHAKSDHFYAGLGMTSYNLITNNKHPNEGFFDSLSPYVHFVAPLKLGAILVAPNFSYNFIRGLTYMLPALNLGLNLDIAERTTMDLSWGVGVQMIEARSGTAKSYAHTPMAAVSWSRWRVQAGAFITNMGLKSKSSTNITLAGSYGLF
jgi:hypothetical protein